MLNILDVDTMKRDPGSDFENEEEEARQRSQIEDPDFDPLEGEFSIKLSYKMAK